MAVQFDAERILIFDQALRYDPYYFALSGEDSGVDFQDVVQACLRQWAEAIMQLTGHSRPLFLPFGVYDQCIECLAAAISEDQIHLRCVWLNVGGYSIDLLDTSGFIHQDHAVLKASPKEFGVFNRLELVTSLKSATYIVSLPA